MTARTSARRILDKKGFIEVQRNDGKAVLCKAGSYRSIVSQLWEELAIYQQDAILRPDYYICRGARVMVLRLGEHRQDHDADGSRNADDQPRRRCDHRRREKQPVIYKEGNTT